MSLTNRSSSLSCEVKASNVSESLVIVDPTIRSQANVVAHRVVCARVQVDQIKDVEQRLTDPHL